MDKESHFLQLTEGYRAARRNTSIVCAIALAWAASQFELKSLNLSTISSIDLANATIPVLLAMTGIYTFLRCTIEYAMQPTPVRRWSLARVDYKLTVWLVRGTALALGASGLYRSLETVLAVVVLALALFAVSMIFMFAGTLVLTPLFMKMRGKHRELYSPVPSVMDAMGWSALIIVGIICILLFGLGVASLHYQPLRLLWPVVPSHTAVAIAVLTAIAVVLSVALQYVWSDRLFLTEEVTETRLSDGTIAVKFHASTSENPKAQSKNSVAQPLIEWPGQ